MVAKEVFKKTFWPIFIIVFIIIAVFVGKTIYDSIYSAQVEKGVDVIQSKNKVSNVKSPGLSRNPIQITDATYDCENDNSIQSRGYVYVHGYGDHSLQGITFLRQITKDDSKVKGILDFDYDEKLSLDKLSDEFINQFNLFVKEHNFDEVVILAQSAGGIIASYSAHKLDFDGAFELHTIASPLSGYLINKISYKTFGGFGGEIVYGFDSFVTPQKIDVYHHKNIIDEELSKKCKEYSTNCEAVDIQNNNIEGSKEFYYEGYDHTTIMNEVMQRVVDCHQ